MNAFQHALAAAGPQAAHIERLWWLTVAVCGIAFVGVLAAFAWALWRTQRADAATPPDLAALHVRERKPELAVIGAVSVSAVLLLGLLVASVFTDRALAQLPLANAVTIRVTGNQWWWDIRYDDAEPGRAFSTANEMVIPVGRPVLLRLLSNDVIHSFWVPNLAGKKDLIPGQETLLQLQADKPGVYRGQCAEFCGLQHAFMALRVTAVPQEEFERWAEAQRQPAAEPAPGDAARGKALFLSGTCMTCHAIQGTTAGAHTAPDLTHVAGRATLAAGRLPNDPERLRAWIEDPQRFKPGVNMPAHRVAADQLDALVAYLGTLK